MEYADFNKLQAKVRKKEQTIIGIVDLKILFRFKYNNHIDLRWMNEETLSMFESCTELMNKEIKRLKKELNEMEL